MKLIGEGAFDRFVDIRRIDDSLIRSFRAVVAFDSFRADSLFRDEFDRGGEEVLEKPPFIGVEVIEQGYELGVV
ncbi:MAG: hypothetical protein OS130_01310 [Thermodesulfobacteriota bacterium]|nr:MAG: hypothetical protein OS130_01310 [Thermodesulfobacteriota bacterium]